MTHAYVTRLIRHVTHSYSDTTHTYVCNVGTRAGNIIGNVVFGEHGSEGGEGVAGEMEERQRGGKGGEKNTHITG